MAVAGAAPLKLPASQRLLHRHYHHHPRRLTASRASWRLREEGEANQNTISTKKPKPSTLSVSNASRTTVTPPPPKRDPLLNRPSPSSDSPQGKLDGLYLGYETWLPIAPKVKKPRSIYNALSLAYLGDCIYELYARRHFLFPPLSIDEYNDRVMAVVRCEAQDALLKTLVKDDYLTEEERDILRWGKNIASAKSRAIKRVGVAAYGRASSLETLVGYLYLTDAKRLEELMLKLGFSAGGSGDMIVEQKNTQ